MGVSARKSEVGIKGLSLLSHQGCLEVVGLGWEMTEGGVTLGVGPRG